jgi:hypothetical protein
VFLWFCFNGWLAFESGEDVDALMLSWLKSADPASSRLRAAFETAKGSETFQLQLATLAGYCPIHSDRPNKPDARMSSADDLDGMLDAIYYVRCNLFHGGKSPEDSRDYKLVKICSLILHKWVGNLVGSFKG